MGMDLLCGLAIASGTAWLGMVVVMVLTNFGLLLDTGTRARLLCGDL